LLLRRLAAHAFWKAVGLSLSTKSADYIHLQWEETLLLQSLNLIRDVASHIIEVLPPVTPAKAASIEWSNRAWFACVGVHDRSQNRRYPKVLWWRPPNGESNRASAGSTEAGFEFSVSCLGESHLGAQLTDDTPLVRYGIRQFRASFAIIKSEVAIVSF
jgi:hypothetical protein